MSLQAQSTPAVSREPVSREEVLRVAELSNLELTDAEVPAMAHHLNAILDHFATLAEVDTTGIPPMAQVAELLALQADPSGTSLREDLIRPSLPRPDVMLAAPESDGRFFKVPKVIER